MSAGGGCTLTIGTQEICSHKNGWFYDVWFLIFFRRVYFCTDCETFFVGKELKKVPNA